MSKLFTKKFIIAAFIVLLTVFSADFIYGFTSAQKTTPSVKGVSLPVEKETAKNLTAVELKKYDGSNPDLPIYIAIDGKIYDVTEGKEYYKTGAQYHYLAGKDSSEVLNKVPGGAVIKRKYPVVGNLIQ